MNLLQHTACAYCGLELEPCRLPFCSALHASWHFWGKPPLAKDPMEPLYGEPVVEEKYIYGGYERHRLKQPAQTKAANPVFDAPGMALYQP